MHRFVLSTMALAVTILASTLVWAATTAPGDLKIGPPEGWKATKTLVDFSHATHDSAKIDCVTCHHAWDGKSDIQSCATTGCHDQTGKKGNNTFYAAFHNKNADSSCLGCHKKTNKKDKTALPVSCKTCHPK